MKINSTQKVHKHSACVTTHLGAPNYMRHLFVVVVVLNDSTTEWRNFVFGTHLYPSPPLLIRTARCSSGKK